MCLLIWIILFNWIILMESGSLPLQGAQTNGEQLASSCDQPLMFIRRQLQALQAAWQGGVPTDVISQHFCSFPFPPHVQRVLRSQHGPEPGLSVGHEHRCYLSGVCQMHGQQDSPSPSTWQTVLIWMQTRPLWLCTLPFPVCHIWPPLHWHLRKCGLLICYWSFFTLIFSNYWGKGTAMICF